VHVSDAELDLEQGASQLDVAPRERSGRITVSA